MVAVSEMVSVLPEPPNVIVLLLAEGSIVRTPATFGALISHPFLSLAVLIYPVAELFSSTSMPTAPPLVESPPSFRVISLSAITVCVELTVVVVPETVRFPAIVTVVPDAPIVSVLLPIVSRIVLFPEVISKSVNAVAVPPDMVGELTVGLVRVLFDSVSEPVREAMPASA